MLNTRFFLLLLGATLVSSLPISGFLAPAPSVAQVRDVTDVSVFHQPLASFGTWTVVAGHGNVWVPRHLRAGWRPYTDGRWVYTDDGWMWVAEEAWGWAPFHYGRWSYAAHHGWFWVPDVVWAPAWVAWRHSPGWIGWAPLPPTALFHRSLGLGPGHIEIAPSAFCFVQEHHLLAPRVVHHMAPAARNVTLINVTRNVTNYTMVNHRVVNRSIAVERIEEVTRQRVPRLRIVEDQDDRPGRQTHVRENEREVVVARPARARTTAPAQETTGKPAGSADAPGVATPKQREKLGQEASERSSDPENAGQPAERAARQERQRRELHSPPPGMAAPQLSERQTRERQAGRDQAHQQRPTLRQQQLQKQPAGEEPQPQAGRPVPRAPSSPGIPGKPSVQRQPPQSLPPAPGLPAVQETAAPSDSRRRRATVMGQPGSEPGLQPGTLTPEARR